jgi:hypothetical protein
MAIAFDNIVGNTTPSTSLSINPSATAGSIIIGGFTNDSNASQTVNYAGGTFTEDVNQLCASSDGGSLFVAHKNNASGSEGALSFTSAQALIGFLLSFSGVDTTTPFDVTSPAPVVVTTMTAAPLVIDSNSITPTTAGSLILAVRMTDPSAGESKPCTFSTQSGSTGAWNSPARDFNNSGGFYNISVGWAPWTSGSIVVRTSTGGAANAAGIVWVCALRPAGAGGSGSGRLVDGNLVNGSLIGSLAA